MAETVFDKILSGEIKADVVHEDDRCIAIRDINPQAPTHLLVIPRKRIETIDAASKEDEALLGHMTLVAAEISRSEGVAQEGYRLVWNCKGHGGQDVYHIHLHVLGGRQMKWPPG